MPNEMVERVGIAIAKATKDLYMVYGVFDYSSYGKEIKPHVVRDFTNKVNQTIGEFHTSDEAQEFYRKVCEAYIAKAAITAMYEPTNKMHKAMCDAYNSPASIWMAGIKKALEE